MKKKTLAIIGESYIGTGKGLYPVELFRAINKISNKYNIKLFLRDNAPFDGPNVIKVKTFKTKLRIFSGLGYHIPLFFKLFKDKSIDMIHAYDVKTNLVAFLLGKPYVVTEYDLYPIFYKFPFNHIFRILFGLLNKARSIIVVSDYLKKLLIEEYPHFSGKTVRIHLGVDTKRFRPPKKRIEDQISIGILGNLDDSTFGDADGELWNIFEKIIKNYGDRIKIILGGKDIPSEFNKLKKYPNVVFKGYIKESELVKHYQSIDIFVYKFNKQVYQPKLVKATATFELIPLEAMASGCAVVASNLGALPEVIKDGGVLTENTEEAFYQNIGSLIENKKFRETIQKKGRKRASELTWENSAREHLKIYDELNDV